MAVGQRFPAESHTVDGVRQVTSHPSIHHHPFYYLPAYDDAMARLVFISHRTGSPQIFAELRHERHDLLQLTDHGGLNEWSIHPSHDGRFVYFTDVIGGCRVATRSLRVERLFAFDDDAIRPVGMVAAAMGTTSLSRDDRWWAVPVPVRSGFRLLMIDTHLATSTTLLERPVIGHPQFHPEDSTLLRYAGPYDQRLWVIRRDGAGHRLVYQRIGNQWIVHETWRPGTRELLAADWPHGVLAIDTDTGAVRRVTRVNAWHPMVDRTGRWIVADTNHPDRGLLLLPVEGDASPRVLCHPAASNAGNHWWTDHCPYDDGPVNVYAPQHTHPHPNFSPDGRRVVFTSDVSGFAQVYEMMVELP